MAIEMELRGVPVTVNGVRVGKAEVSTEGWFTIEFLDAGVQARRIVKMLVEGQADGVSIDANPVQANGDTYRPMAG